MFLLFVLCVVLTTCNANPAKFPEVGPRILNGTKAKPGEYPYIVLLESVKYLNNSRIQTIRCAGTIIDKNWVLTAAHCLANKNYDDEVRIYAGMTDTSVKEITRTGQKIIIHSEYIIFILYVHADIALIRVEEPFESTDLVKPLKKFGRVGLNEEVTAMGYGLGSLDHLSYLKTKTHDAHSDEFVRVRTPNGAACSGDSGSPLINKNGEIVGVNSHSLTEGCYPNTESFYTRVDSYVNWIKEVTKIQDITVS